jgi:type IV pilus assembly protein PilW
MSLHNINSKLRQTGFSLIEIMVALVIGLVATLVITQVLGAFEAQKRGTTGTADAQTNGSLALYALQREVQIAGYGLPLSDKTFSPLKCASFTPAGTDISLVTITDGGATAGASDRITVRYGDTQFAGTPEEMLQGTGGIVAQVNATLGCQVVGEDALVVNGTSCTLTKVVAIQPAGPPQITLASAVNVGKGGKLSCLGTWRQIEFRVTNNQLERNQMVAGFADVVTPVGSDIVAIKAQYGISLVESNNQIVQWVSASSPWTAAELSAAPAQRNRIKAIRLAVVARNGTMEKESVTNACSSVTAAAPTGLCAWDATSANPADLSPAPTINFSNNADWQHYRYRVFETIIPLRNMIWSKEAIS